MDKLALKSGLVFLSSALLILLIFSWHTSSKTLPNLYFAGDYVGNLSRQELERVLDAKIDFFLKNELVFLVPGESGVASEILTTPQNLGLNVNSDASVEKIFSVGRSGVFAQDLSLKLRLLFSAQNLEPVYGIDYEKFSSETDRLFRGSYTPARDATITFDTEFSIFPEAEGSKLNFALLTSDIRERFMSLTNGPIAVQIVADEPRIKVADSQRALERAKLLSNQRISLTFESDSWQLSGQKLIDLVEFSPKGFTDGKIIRLQVLGDTFDFLSITGGQSSLVELNLTLNDDSFSKYIDKIAESINQETVDAQISFDGEKVSQFTPARDGQVLDVELTRFAIEEKLSVDNLSSEKTTSLNLPVSVTRAKIANEEINSLGIKELIGRGVSYFAGSIPNRVHNLTLGSNRITGTIVAPGESFSFNRAVGEVSGATGYKPAYVITSGRTVLDDGGGICQVSTTVFRATLAAGLPIISRTAHAYRVGYYEQGGYKPGYDATVWSPAVDFVFKNNTANHILVQTIVDPKESRLQVDVYGTSDGRKVDLGQPVVSNVKPAPEPRYQDDPTLPKGTTKQVDFAAQGATSLFSRKVFRGDKTLIDETFKSVYRPWQAVYLVGTGG